MKILLLGPKNTDISQILQESKDAVLQSERPISADDIVNWQVDFIVSFRYRHIVPFSVLQLLPGRAINLHISYLPWNRGADPNLWSFIDSTPKGVTIHHMDEGLDTGDIIAQQLLEFNQEANTLSSSFDILCSTVVKLFAECWPSIRNGCAQRIPQPPGGSYHRISDRETVNHLLLDAGWDTPINKIIKH